jgi:glycyl-tRNA synthetase beta chain
VGIFGVGQPPTGNKDPFSLRRAAIAVLRLMIDKGIDVPLHHVIAKAVAAFEHVLQPDTAANVEKFMQGRYKAMYEDQGVAVDVIMAVNDVPVSSPLDFDKRIKAVSFFKGLPAASVLVAANKRVNNILAKHPSEVFAAVQQALLQLPAEQALFAKLNAITPTVRQAVAAHDYAQAMSLLSELKGDVDVFFEQVMVMCDDVALQANRINLLAQLQQQFAQIADIAKIQVA